MAFSEATVASWDTTTEAGWETVAQAIHDRLAAIGLVQTSDTGQLNFASTNTPAINTTLYEIWRFADAAQATDPIFMRIEYGWAGATGRLRMQLTTGTGTNGAGVIANGHAVISGIDFTAVPVAGSTGRIAASFVNGSFCLMVAAPNSSGVAVPQNSLMMVVERLRDPETFALLPGVTYSVLQPISNGLGSFHMRRSGSWASTNSCFAVPPSILAGNRVMAGFYLPRLEPVAPMRACMVLPSGAVGDGDTGTISVHGANATYKKIASPVGEIQMGSIAGPVLLCTD